MPKSKHRRKPGGKAVSHPGRGKPGKPLNLSWLEEMEKASGTTGLLLFDWAEGSVPNIRSVRESDAE